MIELEPKGDELSRQNFQRPRSTDAGPKYATQTQYLHVHMGHLRAKLESDGARPKLLLTEPGVGDRVVTE